MSDTVNSLADLGEIATGAEAPAAPVQTAPLREQQLDKQGRAYATGRRKNAIARVWVKPGTGKITVNGRDQTVYFARPTLRLVINAEKVAFTGKKLQDKRYYKHTGYAGGIKEITADKVLSGRFPERVLEKAVERMIPRGPLGRQQMRNLRIYAGAEHPHGAQNPETLDVAALNRKNKVGA